MVIDSAFRLNDIDFNNPDVFIDGYPHHWWTRLRNEAPVYWHEGRDYPGYWCITKYDDVFRISRDPETFISGKGIFLGADPDNPRGVYRAEADAGGENPMGDAIGKMMIMTDPPQHVKLRRLVSKGFTPRQIALLEPGIRQIVRDILDDVAPRGEADFVTGIAAILPVAVICELMGVPAKDRLRMFELSNAIIGVDDPEYQASLNSDERAAVASGSAELAAYFIAMMQERRETPRSDLVSIITNAEIDGERLTDGDILLFNFLLLLAGNETTRNAISGGMLALIENPEQRQRVLDDPSLCTPLTEEILRWTSPVMHFARFCTRDTEIRGQMIKAGEKVVMWYPSINRDEDIFPNPFTFDVGRAPNEHLAFGTGEHYCLGASLARLEIRVMFEELLPRIPDIELADSVQRLRSNLIGGIKHMPVRFTAGGAR